MDLPDDNWVWPGTGSDKDRESSSPLQPDFLLDSPAADSTSPKPVFTPKSETSPLPVDEVWRPEELLASLAAFAPVSKPKPAGPSPLVAAIVLHLDGKLEEALGELESGLSAGWDGVDIHIARNQLLYELNRFEQALDGYEEVLRLDPGRTGCHFNRGICLERIGRHQEALEAFLLARSLNPADWEAQRNAGIVYLQLNQPAQALQVFEDALARSEDPALLFGKALALQYLGRPREAEAVYRDFLKVQPNCDDALINLIALSLEGRQEESVLRFSGLLMKSRSDAGPALETLAGIELAAENYEAAASLCTRVVQRAPELYEGWFNLGVACHGMQQVDKAVEAFTEAARIRPDSVEARLALGAAHQDAGNFAEATQSYEAALLLDPGEHFALLNLAIVCERTGNLEDAEIRYMDYVGRFPESEEAWYRLGHLRLTRSDFAGALECFNACLGIRPHWPEAQYNLALAMWKSGDAEGARAWLEAVTADQPRFQEAIDALAQIALEQEDFPRALELQRRLLQIGDRSVETLFNTALLLQNECEWDEAISLYREALKERPNLSEALERLGQIHLALGMDDEAKTYFRRARESNLELLDRPKAV